MDWATAATLAGTVLGAGAAAFFASKREVRAQLKAPNEGMETIRTQFAAMQKSLDELGADVKKQGEQMAHLVTDEEFGAYTHHTTQALSKLTEKVGHAAGAIEAWYQTRGTRT